VCDVGDVASLGVDQAVWGLQTQCPGEGEASQTRHPFGARNHSEVHHNSEREREREGAKKQEKKKKKKKKKDNTLSCIPPWFLFLVL